MLTEYHCRNLPRSDKTRVPHPLRGCPSQRVGMASSYAKKIETLHGARGPALHYLQLLRAARLSAEPAGQESFCETLSEVRARHGFRLVGYVVMPEHVHLLIDESAVPPAKVIQVLKRVPHPFVVFKGCGF